MNRKQRGRPSLGPKPRGGDGSMGMDRYVADPHWGGYIIWYFYLGGIAAGAYALAALASLFGDESDRRASRAAHYLAFPLVSLCGPLLIIDLGRPEGDRVAPPPTLGQHDGSIRDWLDSPAS